MTENDSLVMESDLLTEVTDWEKFLSTDSDFPLNLQEKVRTGRPFGPETFFAVIERLTGRDTRMKQPGRLKKAILCPLKVRFIGQRRSNARRRQNEFSKGSVLLHFSERCRSAC